MSEEQPKTPEQMQVQPHNGQEPNWNEIFKLRKGRDERTAYPRELITAGPDLWTKTRVPDAFNLTLVSMIQKWPEVESLDDLLNDWQDKIRQNWISEEGESRREFKDTAIGSFFEKVGEYLGLTNRDKLHEGTR